jgi:hypothetical protein
MVEGDVCGGCLCTGLGGDVLCVYFGIVCLSDVFLVDILLYLCISG